MASSPRVRTRSSTWPRSGSGSGPRHGQAAGEIRQAEARQRALTSSKWKTGWVFATSASSTDRDRTISKRQAVTSGLRRVRSQQDSTPVAATKRRRTKPGMVMPDS